MHALGNEPTLSSAETPEDFEAFGRVCRAYVEWCRERYRDMPWFVEKVFGYQALEDELNGLAQKYGPPAGRTILASSTDGVVRAEPTAVCPTLFANSSASLCHRQRKRPRSRPKAVGHVDEQGDFRWLHDHAVRYW